MTEKFGALAPIYGTLVTSLIAHADRRAGELRHRDLPDRAVPRLAEAADRHAIELLAGIPSIIYGIWGLFVFAPVLQRHVQPFLIETLGELPLIGAPVRRAALRHRHPHRRHHPGDHGAAVHRLGHARRVRDRAADAQGIGLRPGRHDLGSGLEGGAALHAGRRRSAASCWAWAARWARPWPSPSSSATRTGSARRCSRPATTISAAIANEFTEAVGELYTSLADRARPRSCSSSPSSCWRCAKLHADAQLQKRAGASMSAMNSLRRRRLTNRHQRWRCRLARCAFGLLLAGAPSCGRCSTTASPALDADAVHRRCTPPPGSAGGLLNAIYGSVVMTLLGDARSARRSASWPAPTSPNIARQRAGAEVIRFINDILLSAPSIIIGLFVYARDGRAAWATSRPGPAAWRWR